MVGGLCTYLLSQEISRAPSVVSVCVPTFSRLYGRCCGCFVYLPSQRTVWVPWWVFCVPAFSADNMSAIVIVPCTYLLSRHCECHGRCSVYLPSGQTVLALLWVFCVPTFSADSMGAIVGVLCTYLLCRQYWRYCGCSEYLPSLQTVWALLWVFCVPTFSEDSIGAMVERGKWMRG